jgi:hypothetical protein
MKNRKKKDENQDDSSKYKLNKDILDKHMRETNKSGLSIQKLEKPTRAGVLEDISKNSSILTLKVLNSGYTLNKGTQIKMNCLGLLDGDGGVISERRDGITYFGNVPEDEINENNKSFDYSIPVAKTTVEKSDQANMYICSNLAESTF